MISLGMIVRLALRFKIVTRWDREAVALPAERSFLQAKLL
jgi:hypothetical protein